MSAAAKANTTSSHVPTDDRRARILERGRAILRTESEAILAAERGLGDAFVAAIELIVTMHGRVGVTGMGKAGLIGNKVQATLASTGTLAYRFHPIEALHGDIGMIHGDDVILAFSKSGGSELVELMPLLQRMGCKVILVTGDPGSRAAGHADVVLDIGRTEEACPLGLAPSSSAAAMLAVGDALALTVMECIEFSSDQYARNHPAGALGRYLMKADEVMRTGADCPRVTADATLGDCWESIKAAPRRAGAACVVDAEGNLAGIVTQGDFFRMFKSPGDRIGTPVEDVMTRAPKSIARAERAVEALRIMQHFAIDELPVVDESQRLVGMIDIQDLVARGFTT